MSMGCASPPALRMSTGAAWLWRQPEGPCASWGMQGSQWMDGSILPVGQGQGSAASTVDTGTGDMAGEEGGAQ